MVPLKAPSLPFLGKSSAEVIFCSLRFPVPPEARALSDALAQQGLFLKIVNMVAGQDIDKEVYEWIKHANSFLVFGTQNYGEDTGNSACTYNEVKFAQAKGKRIILLRMIPWDQEFDHLQAEVLFNRNMLTLEWQPNTPMPANLPADIARAVRPALLEGTPPEPRPGQEPEPELESDGITADAGSSETHPQTLAELAAAADINENQLLCYSREDLLELAVQKGVGIVTRNAMAEEAAVLRKATAAATTRRAARSMEQCRAKALAVTWAWLDQNGDGIVRQEDMSRLRLKMDGKVVNDEEWAAGCKDAEADPAQGLTKPAQIQLYFAAAIADQHQEDRDIMEQNTCILLALLTGACSRDEVFIMDESLWAAIQEDVLTLISWADQNGDGILDIDEMNRLYKFLGEDEIPEDEWTGNQAMTGNSNNPDWAGFSADDLAFMVCITEADPATKLREAASMVPKADAVTKNYTFSASEAGNLKLEVSKLAVVTEIGNAQAKASGLQIGCRIIAVNDREVLNQNDVYQQTATATESAPEGEITLTYIPFRHLQDDV